MISTDDEIRDRIKTILAYSGLSQKAFADKVGITAQSFSQILIGNRGVPKNLPTKIADAFEEVSLDWILLGTGSPYKDEAAENQEDSAKEKTRPRLPITAAAGTLSDYLGGVRSDECERLPIIRSMPDYDFTMIVKGNSMEPKFEGGDEIACKKVERVIEWGKTYVLATRDGAVLKRIYQYDDGVRCVSYNSAEYPDFIVKGDDILGVYRVVGLVRV